MKTKEYCCPECGSDDILYLAWVDEHGKMVKGYDDPFNVCQSCENQFTRWFEKEDV